MVKKFDWKYFIFFLIGGLAIFLSFTFWPSILRAITCFFDTRVTDYFLVSVSALVTVLHRIKFKKINFKGNMSFSEFKIPIEDLLSFVSNPITIVCSISLARGLFLQSTNQATYFPFTTSTEMGFIFIVTVYLMFISFTELIKNGKELLFYDVKTSTPTPVDEKGNQINVNSNEDIQG